MVSRNPSLFLCWAYILRFTRFLLGPVVLLHNFSVMDVQSMCIGSEPGQLPDDLLALAKVASYLPSPPTSTASSQAESPQPTKSASVKRRRKSPIVKTKYIIQQSDFKRIVPKIYYPDYPRRHRLRTDGWHHSPPVNRLPPRNRSPRAGALFSTQTGYDTSGMTEVDLQYMKMSPAERVKFKLPGTFVFPSKSCMY